MTDDNDLKTFSFRAEKEKVEYLDHLINRLNVMRGPGSENKVVRSDLLREKIDELIDELEEELEEGNLSPRMEAVPTAD